MNNASLKFRGRHEMSEARVNLEDRSIIYGGNRGTVNKLFLGVPVSGTVYGTLLNYKGALAELGEAIHEAPYKEAPKAPVLYIKPVNTLTAHRMPVPLPADESEVEIGAALGVVIGRTATRVNETEALDHVAGYTIVNDISIPHESVFRPAVKQKARDGFCPVGPWVMKRESVVDPDSLGVRVFINDELRQENHTSNLIRPVAKLISDVTNFMTLSAGDTLLVGVPERAPLAKNGDRVRIEIENVGSLENTIINEQELEAGSL